MTTIAKQLIAWGMQIGRWLLERVIRRGAMFIGSYMVERAESVFAKRLAAARKRLKSAKTDVAKRRLNRKIRFLKGRIDRWTRAGSWLIAWATPVAKCVANEVDSLTRAAANLPETPACEKLGRAA